MAEKLDIIDGPGKFDVMASLFEGKVVRFLLEKPNSRRSIEARLNTVQAESGISDRHSWNIEGVDLTDKLNFKGYYASRARRGIITINT